MGQDYPMVLHPSHGCPVGLSFVFNTTVGYQGLYVDSGRIGARVVAGRLGFGRGTSPHIALVVTALLVQPKGAVILLARRSLAPYKRGGPSKGRQ